MIRYIKKDVGRRDDRWTIWILEERYAPTLLSTLTAGPSFRSTLIGHDRRIPICAFGWEGKLIIFSSHFQASRLDETLTIFFSDFLSTEGRALCEKINA